MSEVFKCAMCGETFEKARTEEEALEELNELFGDTPVEECEVVCDDCWQKIRPDKEDGKHEQSGHGEDGKGG